MHGPTCIFWATLTPFSLQWSDEACDDHTCRGILRGGNNYRPLGSRWYFPQPGGLNGEVEDGALDRATSSPNFMGLTSLGLDVGTFCDFLYSVLPFNAVLGLYFLGLALSRPQVEDQVRGDLQQFNALLLLSEGMDRSSGAGFRCVADDADEHREVQEKARLQQGRLPFQKKNKKKLAAH
jgi:hypothetical protein